MRYLCPKHQQAIWLNPELAMTIWKSALQSGLAAQRDSEWQTARNFLGTAYEVALLYLRNVRYHRPGNFTLSHLVETGRPLADVLCTLGFTEEAELCLMNIHISLLQASHASGPKAHCRALDLTGRCVDELTRSLGLLSKANPAPATRGCTARGNGSVH